MSDISTNERVTVIGSGLMGPGIACRAALAGHEVTLVDKDLTRLEKGKEKAFEYISDLVAGEIATAEQGEAARKLITGGESIEAACKNADLVIEAITENIAAKQSLFRDIDNWTNPDCLIASNTSGLSITEIGAEVTHKDRIATAHFWFPAHLVPLVEIVMSDKTTLQTAESMKRIFASWGKAPVIVKKDLPGQLANRILQAVIREALYIVESGLASAEDVDTAIKYGPGLRFPVWGPLEHIDAVGLDLALSVQDGVLPNLCNEVKAPRILRQLVDEGLKGYSTKQGVYDWSKKDMKALAANRDAFIMEMLKRNSGN